MHYEEMDLFLTSTTKHSLFINLELSYIREYIGWQFDIITYTLFVGWEVRMVKNCDRGLETAFSRPRSQFFTIRIDP